MVQMRFRSSLILLKLLGCVVSGRCNQDAGRPCLEALKTRPPLQAQEPGNHHPSLVVASYSDQQLLTQLSEFPARYFRQPLDHFTLTNHTFLQRYWVSTRHYKPGGPVFVLDGGEDSAEDRLPILDAGILDILANATSGLSIVLEHRYYGTSVPVANFTTDSLRWLNNAQSAADSANFMANVNIDGLNEIITAPSRPWIYYGGSYAGARAAHMRLLYPSLVFGAIASSSVTHATLSNWEFIDLIRNYTGPACRSALEHSIRTVDHLLGMNLTHGWIKGLFGLRDLRQDQDFASVLRRPLGLWQNRHWDPARSSTGFDEFCEALVRNRPHAWEADVKVLGGEELTALSGDTFDDLVPLAVAAMTGHEFHFALFNYAKYVWKNIVSKCPHGKTAEQCFGYDEEYFYNTTPSTARAWNFQLCTEWGFFQTAPPDPNHPTIVSRLLNLEYESRKCKLAFPPGEHFTVPPWPNIRAVNSLGDFDIAADRLAFIDGEIDGWRVVTPHSDYASPRNDTVLRPFKLIPGGGHSWDQYGLRDPEKEPAYIRKIHREEVEFVKAWLRDWNA